MCDHYCNNYLGGYYCTCKPGYQLHSDGYSCSGKCSKVRMQQHEGTIRSPGFPHNYPRLTDCSWTVETDAGKRLHFQVNTNFHIEQHQSGFCAYDWIKITDSSGELGTFCGDGVPFNGSEIITTTNWFEVQLHTDYLVQKPGFSITYRTQEIRCKIPPPPMHGSILSPSITTAGPNFVPFGGLIRYDCGVGYRVIGSAKLLCLKDGSLSDDPPVCEVF
uniref:Sushi domain-containing protein n=1 Tax=Ciona savignyi TaxID=51511 RepID=H2YRW4_CIOSA